MKGIGANGKATASPKSKVMAAGKGDFAKGGKTKMFGKDGVAQQPSGTTSPERSTLSRGPAKGGKTKMFGKQAASPQKPGTSSPNKK